MAGKPAGNKPSLYKRFIQRVKRHINEQPEEEQPLPTLRIIAPSPTQQPLPDHQLPEVQATRTYDKNYLVPPKSRDNSWQERVGVNDQELDTLQDELAKLEEHGVDMSTGEGLRGEALESWFKSVGLTDRTVAALMRISVVEGW